MTHNGAVIVLSWIYVPCMVFGASLHNGTTTLDPSLDTSLPERLLQDPESSLGWGGVRRGQSYLCKEGKPNLHTQRVQVPNTWGFRVRKIILLVVFGARDIGPSGIRRSCMQRCRGLQGSFARFPACPIRGDSSLKSAPSPKTIKNSPNGHSSTYFEVQS